MKPDSAEAEVTKRKEPNDRTIDDVLPDLTRNLVMT